MALSSVGPYRILERLGAGAYGEVYLAEDSRLHRRVALKTLSGTSGSDAPERRRRLLREARAAARLNHPHIASVHDVVESEEGVHIVMEYVRGVTLATRIRQDPPPFTHGLEIAIQLADGLAHAHGLGVIHRDLKPANIILSSEGQAKILDFGLARLHEVDAGSTPLSSSDQSVEAPVTVGTPPYMPPEHLAGSPVDARGDIYSLGVTLFELLTGRRPFEPTDRMRLAEAILTAPTPRTKALVPEIPAGLDAIVYRAMARNPTDRYATARDLASDLKELRSAITDAPTRSGVMSPIAPRRGRRVVWMVSLSAVAALALYAAFVAGPWSIHRLAPAAALGPKVVAVLPLAGAAGDPQTESLSAGIADSLITTLSKVPGLTVVSRTATLKYQDRKADADAIGHELGATMLVDGRLERSGDRLRVTLSLLEPGSKTVRWQNAYDGTFAEVFTLQREVAEAVAGELRLATGEPAGSAPDDTRTQNVEAFADYAQARSFLERPDVKDNLDHSIDLFRKAVERDPRFARAHGGLGEAYWRKYQATRDEKWSVDARDAINEALRLDPQDASVRLSLAAVYRGMGRLPEAIEELRRVVAAHPTNDDAHRLLGQLLIDTHQIEAGVSEINQAIRLRPQYWTHHFVLGSALYAAGRYREAIPAFRRVTELQPDSGWGYQMLGASYQSLEDTANARRNYEAAIRLGNAKAHSNLGILLYDQARYEEALGEFQKAAVLEPKSPLKHHNLGDALTRLGRSAEAAKEYGQAIALCRQQVIVNPRDAGTIATLAILEVKLHDHRSALADVGRALALEPHNVDVLYASAVVHALANDHGRAIAALQDALEAGYSRTRASRDPDLAALRTDPRYGIAISSKKAGGAI
jgi:tetratricopeptide (TPR) repeat protein